MRRLAFVFVVLTGCSSVPSVEPASLPPTSTTVEAVETTTTTAATTTTTGSTSTSRPRSPLADLVAPAGSAIPGDEVPAGAPIPVSLTVGSIGIEDASIVAVGVLDDGQMEIPGRTEVGWYRFGPSPGGEGSAVLAAHIAFDNRAGVFRHLTDVELGDTVGVTFDDGTTSMYEVFELAQYAKDELPFERVFAESGSPVVTLISCGGVFDRSAGSYEDNIVVYARPSSG